MTREEFSDFLKKLKKTYDRGEDIDAFVKKHEHKNVYIYNDACLKKIFATEANIALTTDLINASLRLANSNRIINPKLVNPFIPGEKGYKSIEPDILLLQNKGKKPRDRISIEFQHEGGELYKDRLILYIARHTSNMVHAGVIPKLDNLQVVSFQLFDTFPWARSKNYRHVIQFKDQENNVFFNKQTITLVEVKKFFDKNDIFANDHSRLAQWLRAIDTLNKDEDFSAFSQDPNFKVLQKECVLSNFSSRFLLTEAMRMTDIALVKYNATKEGEKIGEKRGEKRGEINGALKKAKEMAKKMLDAKEPFSKILDFTGLTEAQIKAL